MNKKYRKVNNTLYGRKTPRKVIDTLEIAMVAKNRVRVYYGNPSNGESWDEEYETMGYVGRSMGEQKIPLLVHNKNSSGGGALLDDKILKIVDTKTKRVLYQHPKFHTGKFTLCANDNTEFPFSVYRNGELHANFPTEEKANRYIQFITGKRNAK